MPVPCHSAILPSCHPSTSSTSLLLSLLFFSFICFNHPHPLLILTILVFIVPISLHRRPFSLLASHLPAAFPSPQSHPAYYRGLPLYRPRTNFSLRWTLTFLLVLVNYSVQLTPYHSVCTTIACLLPIVPDTWQCKSCDRLHYCYSYFNSNRPALFPINPGQSLTIVRVLPSQPAAAFQPLPSLPLFGPAKLHRPPLTITLSPPHLVLPRLGFPLCPRSVNIYHRTYFYRFRA